jgi:hypothetical protein
MTDKNPHHLCTWDEKADCSSCAITGQLACKWDRKTLFGFYALSMPPLAIALLGMVTVGVLTGTWWPLVAYVVYFVVMLGVFEIRFLCSHCPYYAEDSRILHCLANHGSFKLWRYHPEPMSRLERFLMYFLVATVFFAFPVAILGYGIWFLSTHYVEYGLVALLGLIGITAAVLLAGAGALALLRIFFCSQCVNFSCPLNTVSDAVVTAYLERNEVMRAAWEAAGWRMD